MPEKYFTIYLSPRTELFSHMTARPLDLASRRRPLYAAVALVLMMAAVVLAAGCESPGLANPTFPLQEEKYVLLQQNTDYNATTISGHCLRMNSDYWYDYSFDEKTGNLSVHPVTSGGLCIPFPGKSIQMSQLSPSMEREQSGFAMMMYRSY